MSKKYMKRGLLSAALAAATLGSGSAFALGIPVFDAANLVANGLTAAFTGKTMVIDYYILQEIKKLQPKDMLQYTSNIDSSTKSIDQSTHNIDQSTHNIEQYENWNYEINKTYNDIVNNYYGTGDGGIIPTSIDGSVATMLESGKVGTYTSTYKDANSYSQGSLVSRENLTGVGVKASESQKIANDALVNTLSLHSASIKQQEDGLQKLVQEATAVQGHGNQLQYANALAGAQTAQLMQVREMMLASENARAASAQADADRKSRQVAASQSLREGLAGGEGAIKISGTGLSASLNSAGKNY